MNKAKQLLLPLVLLCSFMVTQVQAEQCKVDRLEIEYIKAVQTAAGLDDTSKILMNQAISAGVGFTVGTALTSYKAVLSLLTFRLR